MRILYVLAEAPFTRQEQFVLTEGETLLEAGDDVRFLPLRPGRTLAPDAPARVVERTLGARTWQPRTLARAAATIARRPSIVGTAANVLTSRSTGEPLTGPAIRNVLTLPKALAELERIRAWRPDHIHAHFAASTATAAWILGEALGVPWSFTAHSPTDISKRNLLAAKVDRATFVRAISDDGARRLEAGLPPRLHERIEVIHMGVHRPGDEAGFPHRGRYARGNEPSVVCVARLVPGKGQALLLEAIRRVRHSGRAVACHLIGDGPDREALSALAGRLGIQDLVHMHGYVPNPEVLAALRSGAFDAFILPSRSEGIPIVLMEALACGVPAIATSVGGVSEIVTPGGGRLVPPDDAEALAAAIAQTIEAPPDPEIGRRLVAREYCLSRNVATLRERFAASVGARSRVLTGR